MDISTLSAADQAALAGLLSKLQQNDAESPAMAKKQKKVRKAETVKFLTVDQITKFFKWIESVRDTAIFRTIYHRGLRASELGKLQISDLSLSEGRIRFERLKGSYGGQFRLCSSEERALKAWIRVRGTEAGPLFPSREGKGISQQMLDVLMKRYCKAAGIPADLAHVHTLKHSCATHLLERGESIEEVQDHLGHRNIQNTQIYAKFTSPRRQARDKRLRDW
jgi:site-specific recombinase XerC